MKINSRERKRMHDLNSALESLRKVMPYGRGPTSRKLSKISTLLLARNYILSLNQSLEEARARLGDTSANQQKTPPALVESTLCGEKVTSKKKIMRKTLIFSIKSDSYAKPELLENSRDKNITYFPPFLLLHFV